MKKKKLFRIILIIVILLLIVGLFFFSKIKAIWQNSDDFALPQIAANKQSLNVNGVIIKAETLNDVFRTKGILMPDEEVHLAFESSGRITRILFSEGTVVKEGMLLAKINDESLQAELAKLQAQLPLANDRVARQKALFEKDAVSSESYETVFTELEKLKADISLVEARIRQTQIIAPFDGRMGLRQLSEGAYISPTTEISTLTKISPLKLEFYVNEKQADKIHQGTKLTFTLENDLRIYHATVYAVESKLDDKTLSLKVRALYPNSDEKLQPGRSVAVEINLETIENTIVIPSIASIAQMGKSLAFVYQNGKAKQMEIRKGMRTASSIQVLEGLNLGDTLIVSGVMQLRDELPVHLHLLNE
jgi:membrane fusion protein (multidrug efflux system)